MESVTFNDVDRMKEIVNTLKAQEKLVEKIQTEPLLELLDELQDLVEMHPRSNHNFCLFGGMHELLSLIISHPNEKVRKASCSIFSSICQNNDEVQEFANKAGAINLTC
jgi:hypothetical protein